jgi:hypothetical protein
MFEETFEAAVGKRAWLHGVCLSASELRGV